MEMPENGIRFMHRASSWTSAHKRDGSERRNIPWHPIANDLNGLLINYAWFDIQVNECWCFLLRCFLTLPCAHHYEAGIMKTEARQEALDP